MMFHPKHVLIKDEFQKHRMDYQSDIIIIIIDIIIIIIIIIYLCVCVCLK